VTHPVRTRPRTLVVLGGLAPLLALASLATIASGLGIEEQRAKRAGQEVAVRARARQLLKAGNFRESLEISRRLALQRTTSPTAAGEDLKRAILCLGRLGRTREVDALRDKSVEVHRGNWRLLLSAATSLADGTHSGRVVAGEYQRGSSRGRGSYVSSFSRDRSKALGWLEQARPLVVAESAQRKDQGQTERGRFYIELARILLQGRDVGGSWRLAILTDTTSTPDFDQNRFGFSRRGYSGTPRGAPVDDEDRPVFHAESKTYKAAVTDGQRWRWALAEAVRVDPGLRTQSLVTRARFLWGQFGVQTMRFAGIQLRETDDDDDEPAAGPWSVRGLAESETIAKLASGVQRFKLPREHNHIALLIEATGVQRGSHASSAADLLASVFENRQQYTRAAIAWRDAIGKFGPGNNSYRRKRLDQIIGRWGAFERAVVAPAGTATTIDYRFRNGSELKLEAHSIRVDQLLGDVKTYIKGKPKRIDYNAINVENIGYRLVQQNQQKYVGERVAAWTQKLSPRPGHLDRLVTLKTSLKQAGAYLVTARMTGGNVSRIILWISDTALVHKRINGGDLYYVADSVSGSPIAGANVEFFGYERRRVAKQQYRVDVRQFAALSNADGLVVPRVTDPKRRFRWLVVARGAGGRRAYLGFRVAWTGRRVARVFDRTRVYVITDRPVYRPGQAVKFKFWIRQARFDKEDGSVFAGRRVTIRVTDPRNQELVEREFTTDAYGGFDGELPLADDANLGNYSIRIVPKKSDLAFGVNKRVAGGGSFRVEEYKKPEFEVTVEAPKRPVRLGETITAKIKAKYYFGGPVGKATVKYRVERESHQDHWFPVGRWDWLYGPGYGWFASEYKWYPGWRVWGCLGPRPAWFGRPHQPPELVMEDEVEIGEDGTVELKIDTSIAKRFHPDTDHRYRITAEVVDASRRTIVGTGAVMAARQPFRVRTWVDRGFYRTGETIRTTARARTLDGRPVSGKARFVLYRITYDKLGNPKEKKIRSWDARTDEQGRALVQMLATDAGQYRIACEVEDDDEHRIEGAQVFLVRGPEFDGKNFRFNDLELVADRREYKPGQVARLMLNTNRRGSTVLLFVRPEGSVYPRPRVVRMKGKSTEIEIPIGPGDRPNIFVEAITVSGGKVHTSVRELFVPPEKRVVHVDIKPSSKEYRPGAPATIDVALKDSAGKPFSGSLVLTMYDKSVEYISGGSNVGGIRQYFWSFRRSHYPQTTSNLVRSTRNLLKRGETGMSRLGVFGDLVATQTRGFEAFAGAAMGGEGAAAESMSMDRSVAGRRLRKSLGDSAGEGAGGGGPLAVPTLRSEFADTALWVGSVTTDKDGHAQLKLDMPENLTTWTVRAWAMGHGTNVGEGTASVLTTKNVLVRLQAPRFFTENDEVVVSANVHNYLDDDKMAVVRLELDGGTLAAIDPLEQKVHLPAGGEARVDWRVKVTAPGEARVRMAVLTDVESDAMELTFPVHVHGMQKTVSGTGVLRADRQSAVVEVTVPMARRPERSRLEIRYSPTLAGAMVDALPYLVDFEYGCTEQTLNRFLPTVITHNLLRRMKIDLEAVRKKRTNLNAGELGEGAKRARRWKRWKRNPVFDNSEVTRLVKDGVKALGAMQQSDGGWGWFSGRGERSSAHTTATVVHGLSVARTNDVQLPPGVYENGVAWLKRHQGLQVRKLKNAPTETSPYKFRADNLDALVFRVLVEADVLDQSMSDFLYRDRVQLSVYSKGLLGLAYQASGQQQRLAMIIRNIDQFLQQDDENQTAWLQLPESTHWWRWYGNEVEANAIYLKLLALTDPNGVRASRLVKYLLNNRRHATYWNSTRDTALCIESLAEYLDRSGESTPDVTIDVLIDGKLAKSVKVNSENLFSFDNALVLEGAEVTGGKHTIEIRRRGRGPVYFNTWLSYFTTEDFIGSAGLEIKVQRKYYRLVQRKDATSNAAGGRGQALKQSKLVYDRQRVDHLGQLTSGDLVEIELEIESKNDYEYLVFEDPKGAGFEPVDRQSGYVGGYPRVYRQLRDDRVVFFFRTLNRGRHSVSYRVRAEIPGTFSALPTRGSAMYAPELKANSDEIRLGIADRQ